jgi:hypothetical protein
LQWESHNDCCPITVTITVEQHSIRIQPKSPWHPSKTQGNKQRLSCASKGSKRSRSEPDLGVVGIMIQHSVQWG